MLAVILPPIKCVYNIPCGTSQVYHGSASNNITKIAAPHYKSDLYHSSLLVCLSRPRVISLLLLDTHTLTHESLGKLQIVVVTPESLHTLNIIYCKPLIITVITVIKVSAHINWTAPGRDSSQLLPLPHYNFTPSISSQERTGTYAGCLLVLPVLPLGSTDHSGIPINM